MHIWKTSEEVEEIITASKARIKELEMIIHLSEGYKEALDSYHKGKRIGDRTLEYSENGIG